MNFKKNLILSIFFSQFIFLGVFGLEKNQFYVIGTQTNICGLFTRGNAESPNWLPENWKAIYLDKVLEKKFSANISCINGSTALCCSEMGYKYSKNPIGQISVEEYRYAAEFLGSKKIINAHSFFPGQYNIKSQISRKELMKVILNTSGKKLLSTCQQVYLDVLPDWGCKYIESALEYDFIAGNKYFRPDESVTKVEALKLIFQARNIEKRYETAYWQEDYISSAYYLGYIDEKFKDTDTYASRGWIFQALSRTYPEYTYK